MTTGLTVYAGNPRYFALDGKPVFLTGATPTWTPISNIACDFVAENKALVDHGGNFTRILTFFPGADVLVPWARANTDERAADSKPLFDLTTWESAYWDRLRSFLRDCEKRSIVVCLEFFDEPSIRYNKGPQMRWAVHPFNPANNVNLTTDEGLPAGPHGPTVREFYDAVRLPKMKRVLELQKRYVEKLLQETAPWSNRIIYSICNEYTYNEGSDDAHDKTHAFAFPRFWGDFVHEWGAKRDRRPLVAMMPGRSPDRACYFDDLEFRKYLDNNAFDAIDMAENLTPADVWASSFPGMVHQSGVQLARALRRYYGRWIEYQRCTDNIKPLFNSKILYRCITDRTPPSPEPIWALFFLGAAVSRCHRPHGGPEGDIDGQREAIAHLRVFVDRVPFWTMQPRHELVSENALCLADEGRTYAALVPGGGELAVYVPEDVAFEVQWCAVTPGEFFEAEPVRGVAGGITLTPPFDGPAAVLLSKAPITQK